MPESIPPPSLGRASALPPPLLEPISLPPLGRRDSKIPEVALEEVRDWVKDQLGIRFDQAQHAIFKTRIDMFCRSRRISVRDALHGLRAGNAAMTTEVAEVVSTNHTSFFREQEMFEYFTGAILADLPVGPIRMWSAASSSGEEAYSMAFCARHVFGAGASSRVRILGTDISERQVRRAEGGTYRVAELSQLPPALKSLLEPAGPGELRIPTDVKAMCTYRRMNLTQFPWPFQQRFHVIFLRNVLYYFEPEMQRRVVESCYDVIEPGGWLVTSLTEPLLDVSTRWTRVGPGLHRREG